MFLVDRSDGLGFNAAWDADQFIRRRQRKAAELRELLAATGLAEDPLVHVVAPTRTAPSATRREPPAPTTQTNGPGPQPPSRRE